LHYRILSWIKWDNKNQETGLGYCCDYSDLKETILEMPELDSNGVLLNAKEMVRIAIIDKFRSGYHSGRNQLTVPIGGGIKKPNIYKGGRKFWGK
jgi:hypothetical protein